MADNLNPGFKLASAQKPFSQPLAVLHVHSGNLFGGIERALLTCVDNLRFASSLRFNFALCFEGEFAERLKRAKQSVHRLPEVRFRNPLSILSARRALTGVLRGNHYDAVICHSPWSHSIFAPVLQRLRVPELLWAHDYYSGKHWLERLACRSLPAFVISNSRYTDSSLPCIFPAVPHRVIPCPVDVPPLESASSHRHRIREALQTPQNAVVVIQVSRLERRKGQQLLLEAASRLTAEQNWIVWIIGGPQREEEARFLRALERHAKDLRIWDRVRFAGERTDIAQLMAAADIFCQPNANPEPFGLVFVEALGAGLPVLTFDMGGASEIVNETCGILVSPGDTSKLAAELQRLVCDPELRRRLSSAGPARAHELCDPARILPELERLILEVATTNAEP